MIRASHTIWAIFALFICALTLHNAGHHTVTLSYLHAAQHWLAGTPLYNGEGNDYIYFPQGAIFYIPFAKLPFALSETIWRLMSMGLLAYSLACFCRLAPAKHTPLYFLVMTIVCLALGYSSLRNGQFNLIIVSAGLLSLYFARENKWWHCALFLSLGFALKPTMIVFLLLMVALYRPLWWRVPLFILGFIFLPFLTQSPSYVISQYHAMLSMLVTASNVGSSQIIWAQLFGFLGQFNLHFSNDTQTGLRILAALIVLAIAWRHKNNKITLYTLAASYLMLFNPRTENNDYIILAPAFAFCLASTLANKQHWHSLFLSLLTLGFIVDYPLAKALIPGQASWLAPLLALTFIIYYLIFNTGKNSHFVVRSII